MLLEVLEAILKHVSLQDIIKVHFEFYLLPILWSNLDYLILLKLLEFQQRLNDAILKNR